MIILILVLVFMAVVGGWLAIRIGLPKNPKLAYFPDESSRLPKVHWILGQFQPVYLYAYTKDGTGYIKAAYRDSKGKIRMIDLFAGGGKEKIGYAGLMLSGVGEAVKTVRY